MSSKPGGLLRSGRRQSTPTSPTSPTFLRRLNRSQDVFPPESTPNESPSIDLTVPSPTFDLASISPSLAPENRFAQRPQSHNRSSDDFGKSRPRFLAETTRPATSNAEGSSWSTAQPRCTYSPEQPSSRNSPSLNGPRISSEGSGRSSSRENQDVASGTPFRSTAFSSQHDRNTSDEGAGLKGIASAKKSRFNLTMKSPRNLFARRRSSQVANKLDDGNVAVGKMHVPAMPDNIETSIRGSIVHDFSKPRSRRPNNDTSPRPDSLSSPNYPRRPSEFGLPSAPPSAATPTSLHFREHFQDDRVPSQPTHTAYLHNQNLQLPSPGNLPDFAKRLPFSLSNENGVPTPPIKDSHETKAELGKGSAYTVPPEPEVSPPPPPPSSSPPLPPATASPEEPLSPVLDLPPIDTLPKHMTSTSSRFSFQIGQQGSIAQEKILEERHKEHVSRKPDPARISIAPSDDLDDYDYEDDMDDEDGFHNDDVVIRNIDMPSSQYPQTHQDVEEPEEEETYGYDDDDGDEFGTDDIVVKNIDMPTSQPKDTEDGNNYNVKRQSLQAFHFTPQSLSFSPSTAQYTSTSTPRDFEGLPIGMAQSKEGLVYSVQPQIRNSLDQSSDAMFLEGLGISTLTNHLPAAEAGPSHDQPFDDLYFDDGEFDDNVVGSDADFDEDMLDDAEHIRDIPAENSRRYEEALNHKLSEDHIRAVAHDDQTECLPQTPGGVSLPVESPQTNREDLIASKLDGLTEGNLAAYHDALAQAANQAAANGKFDRVVSFSRVSDDETDSPFQTSIPALSSRGSKYSNNVVESGISDNDGFGFEDDMDDEAMIAAANAEALENDDDGFYGQEFGFYARAHGKDSAEFSSGGYFTSRGSNGIKRSHSGKNNFQEPSLTPITEISEWSARNSVASLVPGLGQVLSSPGTIAEFLERDSPIVEDEMSWAALSKLRSKTFGGSSTSVNSLGDRHHVHSSPLAHLSGHSINYTDAFNGRLSASTAGVNGTSIAESEDEDEDEDWGRPTLTQNTPHRKRAEPVLQSLHDQITGSPLGRKKTHSRNSSGAESVSYALDTDGRWIQERRRTGDDGEVELVEREYLAGARI